MHRHLLFPQRTLEGMPWQLLPSATRNSAQELSHAGSPSPEYGDSFQQGQYSAVLTITDGNGLQAVYHKTLWAFPLPWVKEKGSPRTEPMLFAHGAAGPVLSHSASWFMDAAYRRTCFSSCIQKPLLRTTKSHLSRWCLQLCFSVPLSHLFLCHVFAEYLEKE